LSSYIAQQTTGPVVLVGHSYGGAVITNAALADPNVEALVYIDAFIPDQGESLGSIIAGSTSALNVADPTTIFNINGYPGAPAGDADVYLKKSTFDNDFAQDLPPAIQNVLSSGQLPITLAALSQPSGVPAWKTLPSWDVVGTADKVLPEATQLAMAKRAGSKVTEVNASHLSMLSKPLQVTAVIEAAARSLEH
jgi:pimeloyl-ACP methyl ester carboxylesterase